MNRRCQHYSKCKGNTCSYFEKKKPCAFNIYDEDPREDNTRIRRGFLGC